jgi:hypothetical protein
MKDGACMEERRNIYRILVGKSGAKRPFESVDRRIILKWIVHK